LSSFFFSGRGWTKSRKRVLKTWRENGRPEEFEKKMSFAMSSGGISVRGRERSAQQGENYTRVAQKKECGKFTRNDQKGPALSLGAKKKKSGHRTSKTAILLLGKGPMHSAENRKNESFQRRVENACWSMARAEKQRAELAPKAFFGA